ncbi:hypothetical protein EVAR_67690_1 [Eumeta japonica]|uniref:Uncharacterized protein n=1 Tax=Eumeta variegata TaxID=151549 RepID=A0A4C1ZNG0_EUMVA|nr:hypothetical protein EVAR_67690_1 [Eumeta japonica]
MPGRLLVGDTFRRSSGDGPISGFQILKFPESVGDPGESSVDSPSSSSTVTAGSGSDDEVVGRRSVRTGELDDGEPRRYGKTTTFTPLSRVLAHPAFHPDHGRIDASASGTTSSRTYQHPTGIKIKTRNEADIGTETNPESRTESDGRLTTRMEWKRLFHAGKDPQKYEWNEAADPLHRYVVQLGYISDTLGGFNATHAEPAHHSAVASDMHPSHDSGRRKHREEDHISRAAEDLGFAKFVHALSTPSPSTPGSGHPEPGTMS